MLAVFRTRTHSFGQCRMNCYGNMCTCTARMSLMFCDSRRLPPDHKDTSCTAPCYSDEHPQVNPLLATSACTRPFLYFWMLLPWLCSAEVWLRVCVLPSERLGPSATLLPRSAPQIWNPTIFEEVPGKYRPPSTPEPRT